jgi:Cu+-exporting ATPase
MPRDPICGMQVDETKAIKFMQGGLTYYFCSQNCKEKFLMRSHTKKMETSETKSVYTCPMHPEIRQDKPGDCPKCGMHLEAASPAAQDVQ